MDISGRCHCGNIEFTLDWAGEGPEIPVRACSCSFCRKHGAIWTSTPDSRLAVTMRDPSKVSRYRFGTQTSEFHVCSACGAVPLATCRIADRTYAVVNANTFENVEASRLRGTSTDFSAEDVGSRLDRRERNWIADVRFSPGSA